MTRSEVVRIMHYYDHHLHERPPTKTIRHIREMFPRMTQIEDMEKIMRWLGFIQGVLWCTGVFTVDELHRHNKDGPPRV